MSEREYAEHRRLRGLTGVTQQAVNKAVATGRITKVVDPETKKLMIDAAIADAQWERNTDQDQALRTLATSSAAGPAGSSPATMPQGAGEQLSLEAGGEKRDAEAGSPGISAAQAQRGERAAYIAKRTEREEVSLELARLELAKETGALVSKDEQRSVSFQVWRSARDQLRTIPERTADLLAAETDPAVVRTMLLKEIDQVLNGLSDFARAEAAGGAGERVSA